MWTCGVVREIPSVGHKPRPVLYIYLSTLHLGRLRIRHLRTFIMLSFCDGFYLYIFWNLNKPEHRSLSDLRWLRDVFVGVPLGHAPPNRLRQDRSVLPGLGNMFGENFSCVLFNPLMVTLMPINDGNIQCQHPCNFVKLDDEESKFPEVHTDRTDPPLLLIRHRVLDGRMALSRHCLESRGILFYCFDIKIKCWAKYWFIHEWLYSL